VNDVRPKSKKFGMIDWIFLAFDGLDWHKDRSIQRAAGGAKKVPGKSRKDRQIMGTFWPASAL
jgi:hypothetical protein